MHGVPQLVDRPLLADDHPRLPARRRVGERRAALAGRDDVRADVAERDEPAVALERGEAAEPAPRDVLEEDALDRVLRAEGEDLVERRERPRARPPSEPNHPIATRDRVAAMPIHVRAEPGDYAEAVLLPGDPLRAKYIAETYLDDVVQTNTERGMLGFRGTLGGQAGVGAGDRHGLPVGRDRDRGARQLGCKKLLRVGTCGGLQPDHELGDMIVALTAVPAGRDDEHLRRTSRTARPPTGSSSTRPSTRRRRSASRSTSGRSSRATSSTTRTAASTSAGRTAACSPSRWRRRSSFTLGALRKVHAGCLLTVSDIVVEGEFTRITDEELRAAVDRMTRVALAAVTAD